MPRHMGHQSKRTSMPKTDLSVLELSRLDRERYLCALTAPHARRAGLMALIAYNQELARIAESVSEPMMGKIKLQWWIDVVPGILQGRPPSHPVAQALAQVRDALADRASELRTIASPAALHAGLTPLVTNCILPRPHLPVEGYVRIVSPRLNSSSTRDEVVLVGPAPCGLGGGLEGQEVEDGEGKGSGEKGFQGEIKVLKEVPPGEAGGDKEEARRQGFEQVKKGQTSSRQEKGRQGKEEIGA